MTLKLRKSKVWVILYLYWAILLLWQNIRSVGNHSTVDIIVKFALLFVFIVYYFLNSKYLNRNVILCTLVLLVSVCVPLSSTALGMRTLLYYFYPIILYFLVFAADTNFKISTDDLLTFCNVVILTVWYIVLYALIFCQDQFQNAFSISIAYGNELSSFLVSNYEYGLYLVFGIFFCVICCELRPHLPKWQLGYYLVTIAVFFVNLILTFSRTSIIAFAAILLIYLLFYKKAKLRKWFLAGIVVFVLLLCFSDTFRSFFLNIVFKGNANAGRSNLVRIGIQMYKDGNIFQKIFGMPYDTFSSMVEDLTEHGSLHNAYIQVLLTNGLVGLLFIVAIIIHELYDNIRCLKKFRQNHELLKLFVGFIIGSGVFMLTTTGIIFESSIDAYFLTMCAIIIPKYVRNAIQSGEGDL